jgi:hypothetical protein
MLLKRFSFDIEHISEKCNELLDTFSRQVGDEIFDKASPEAEKFLIPERDQPEEPQFLAFLYTAKFNRRSIESEAIDPQLREENRQDLISPLREGQDLQYDDRAFRTRKQQTSRGGEYSTSIHATGDMKGHLAVPLQRCSSQSPGTAEIASAVRKKNFEPELSLNVQKHVHAFIDCMAAKEERLLPTGPPRA